MGMQAFRSESTIPACMFFFFQAEDGIRDVAVTGVQTCALPIWPGTLGAATDLLALSVLISALCARGREEREQAARKPPAREDDRAACSAQSAARRGSGATAGAGQPATGGRSHEGRRAAGGPDRQDAGREGGRR